MKLLLEIFNFSLKGHFLDHLEPPGAFQCGGYLPCWVVIFEPAIITLAGLPCSCMSARILLVKLIGVNKGRRVTLKYFSILILFSNKL